SNGKWVSPLHARFEILQNNSIVRAKDVDKQITFTGTKEELVNNPNISIDGAIFLIPHGINTKALLIIRSDDPTHGTTTDTLSQQVYMPQLKRDTFSFGSVELASSLTKTTDRSNPFEKAGYIVLPNPSKVFGGEYNTLNFYSELYI